MMTLNTHTIQVAVIGSGLAGSACAGGLQRAGAQVTLFEKAKAVGGHTATRSGGWIDANGTERADMLQSAILRVLGSIITAERGQFLTL